LDLEPPLVEELVSVKVGDKMKPRILSVRKIPLLFWPF